MASEEKIFYKSTNQKQELPVAAMFVTNWDEMSNLYRGHAIDASYQVSLHLAEGVSEEKIKMWKVMDDGRQVMAKAHIAFGKVS